MQTLPVLYKTKDGKTLFWEISVSTPKAGCPYYTVKHGYVGGAIQETSTDVPTGKNEGRANETNAVEQCELEAKSLWTKQKERKGYTEDKSGIKAELAPMLAHSYDEYPNKARFPLLIQPKLDGIRCLAFMRDNNVVLLSRQRKEFKHLDHIREVLKKTFFAANRKIILDGELYAHGTKFQSIISAVKRDEPSKDTAGIEYHIYDNMQLEYGCYTRIKYLENLFVQFGTKPAGIVKLVDSRMVNNQADIDKWHLHYTNKGYEGLILRNTHGLYVPDKRSFDLLKYKKFKDQEFEIIGVEECKGKLKGSCSFLLKTKEGQIFKAMPEGSQEHRESLFRAWNDGVIKYGDMATVRFFSWSDSVPAVPRFPIFVAPRTYE